MFDEPANDLRASATLRQTARLSGIGLHTGQIARLTIEPAQAGAGIVFIRTDLDAPLTSRTISADPALVTKTQLGTVMTNAAGISISTVEHLMAAFAMLGITDARVFCSGPEIPILDGSAKNFVEALEAARTRVYAHTIEPVAPRAPLRVAHEGSWVLVEPLPENAPVDVVLDVTIDFDDPTIGTQRIVIEGDRETVMREVAEARTFTFLKDVEALRKIGLARGGSLENAVVIDENGVVNEGGLRIEREFVRHKVLDLVGDLYLVGAPLGCKVTAYKPGHTINTMTALALAEDAAAAETHGPIAASA